MTYLDSMWSLPTAFWRTVGDGVDASYVVGQRLPMLALATAFPSVWRQEEGMRMVTEKMAAGADGMVAVSQLWTTALLDIWHCPLPSDPMTATVDAYIEPSRKTLQANARRLSQRSPSSAE
mgnify:FL=1